MIATDCISEGQNLQDCDTVINFDIQWNPVSLIQRFGRIDRIGSENNCIQMINFFLNLELNEYLGLEQRVKGKMTTLNLVSTGDEDVLSPEMNDFNFRKRQLERLKNEVIEIEDTNENISLTDLNINENKNIKNIPKGIYSITSSEKKGVLFCFKHRNLDEKPKSDSSLYPYYLIFVNNNGELLYNNSQAREVVKLFRKICYGKKEPLFNLIESFLLKTKNTDDMSFYSKLLDKAILSIKGEEEKNAIQSVFDFGGFNNKFEDETVDDFELENIKKAKYISEIYQRLIKSPCVLRIYDNNKEIYSFALKRLNQNDKNEIVISDEFLTDEFEVYLPSSSKREFENTISFEKILNRTNKLTFYSEIYAKTFILKYQKIYQKSKELLEKPIWYDESKSKMIYELYKNMINLRTKIEKTNLISERVKCNQEIKEILKKMEEIGGI